MDDPKTTFRNAVRCLVDRWLSAGLPSRQVLDQEAAQLSRLRVELGISGLWEHPPKMMTATLDDGLGQGLAIIEAYAQAVGIEVNHLGLLQSPQAVVDHCHRELPELVGLTVLQFDTEEDLKFIADHLPSRSTIVAGGPVFSGDPSFARRTGTHQVARNVADFLRLLLKRSG